MPEFENRKSQKNKKADYTVETLSSGSSTMYILRNLDKYTLYEVRVQPFYSTVEGQDSNAVRVRTFEDGEYPISLYILHINIFSLKVS